jgi:hypothetical protein
MAPMLMTSRREAFGGLGALAALWAVPTVAAAQGAVLNWTPKTLTPVQARTLDAVAEVIFPATDTPGAREAGVPKSVDAWLGDYCPAAQAAAIKGGLDRIEADAQAQHKQAFAALGVPAQTAILARYDNPAAASAQPVGRGETETGLSNKLAAAPPPPFFYALKDLITAGYFTSQVGATKAVRYDPVPGAYHGCVPLKQIGRAWAT